MGQKLIIVGAGGNSKVILDAICERKRLLNEGLEILGFLDDSDSKEEVKGYPVLGKVSGIKTYEEQEDVAFVDAIGSNFVRKSLYEQYSGARWYTVIHPSAIVGSGVRIGEGAVIMPGAVINADACIGKKALINTGAIVEHDNCIGDFVHLASGVTTAGNVQVGESAMLGTGAKVIQGLSIGARTVIGAGAVVISDIPEDCTAVGVPAKVIKQAR